MLDPRSQIDGARLVGRAGNEWPCRFLSEPADGDKVEDQVQPRFLQGCAGPHWLMDLIRAQEK